MSIEVGYFSVMLFGMSVLFFFMYLILYHIYPGLIMLIGFGWMSTPGYP